MIEQTKSPCDVCTHKNDPEGHCFVYIVEEDRKKFKNKELYCVNNNIGQQVGGTYYFILCEKLKAALNGNDEIPRIFRVTDNKGGFKEGNKISIDSFIDPA